MGIKSIALFIIFFLITYCQINTFNFTGLPRYLASIGLWRFEEDRQQTENMNSLSPVYQEPLYSYEFTYHPKNRSYEEAKKIKKMTSIRKQLEKIEQAFIKLKNLFNIPNGQWEKIKKLRQKRKLAESAKITALQKPRFFYRHNPLLSAEMIKNLETIFSALGLNLYSCDIQLGLGKGADFLKILPTKSSYLRPVLYFTKRPIIKPILLMDMAYRNVSKNQKNDFEYFLSLLIETLMQTLASYNVDDYYIDQIQNRYSDVLDQKGKWTQFMDITKYISDTRAIINDGVISYLEQYSQIRLD